MTTVALKKQLNTYLPLLTNKQQELVLEMVKNILHVDNSEQRISLKQYNKELSASEQQIKKGKYITQSNLEKESDSW